MSNIVERLRSRCEKKYINALCEDAADEIERLTAECAHLFKERDNAMIDRDGLEEKYFRLQQLQGLGAR